MGQVPGFVSEISPSFSYLLIGSGRVAHHIQHYFKLSSLAFETWNRSESEEVLSERASHASHVLILISDSEIEKFIEHHRAIFAGRRCLHFSGALSLREISSAHPLMSFSESLYDLQAYQKIPFILESGRGSFEDLLPGLGNPHFEIECAKKSLYHALCVLSGNYTILLWEKVFSDFAAKLQLPKEALLPYLQQIAQNLATAPSGQSVLTGPLKRGDHTAIERHLNELKDDPYAEVYRAFVTAYSHPTKTYEDGAS